MGNARKSRISGILPVSGKILQIQGTGSIPIDSWCDSVPNYGVKVQNGPTGTQFDHIWCILTNFCVCSQNLVYVVAGPGRHVVAGPGRDGTQMVRGWYADGTRMVRGWYADGTRMVRGWYANGTRMVRGYKKKPEFFDV